MKAQKPRTTVSPPSISGAADSATKPPSPPISAGRVWGLGLLLIAITFAVYLPVIRCGYIWDDDSYLQNNQTIRTVDGLRRIWFELRASPQYYPMVFTSFWLEYRLWGLHPAGYHIVNILLHAGGAVLLWRILALLGVRGAWVAAAIFAVHPINVESVAWITERKNVLSGVFYFGAALLFLRGALGAAGRLSARRYAAVFVLLACALLSKSVTCTLPAALLLVLWWKRDRLGRRDLLVLAPLFVLGIASGLLTAWMEKGHVGAVGEDWNLSFLDRCLIAGRVISFYAGKLIWPHPLIFTYPRWHIDAGAWLSYLYPFAVLAVIAALWAARRRLGRGPLIGVLFFVGTLFPALGFFNVYPMRFSFVADHFQYLAGVGVIVVLTVAGARLADLRPQTAKTIAAASTVLILAALAVLTSRQCPIYKNEETLWTDTLAKNPEAWIAYSNLAPIFLDRGEADKAETYCREALRLRPNSAEAYFNLGSLRMTQRRLDEAVAFYRRAIELIPNVGVMHLNLGAALHAQGKFDEAIAEYRLALQLSPADIRTHRQIGTALQAQDKTDEAIAYYQQALQANPNDAEVHCNLGIALMDLGRLDEAVAHCRESLRINPNSPNARFALGTAMQLQGKLDEAITQYHTALRIKPDYFQAYYTLGTALEAQGQPEQAIQCFRQAVQAEPNWIDPMIHIAWLLATNPDPGFRQPDEAVRLAERATEISQRQNAQALDTLAAAYAAAGQFPRAVAAAEESLRLVATQAPPMVNAISKRLELYKQNRAYQEQPGSLLTPSP